jgi:F-type H+-transporting ATPase subunit delta
MGFLSLLARNRREALLPDIARSFLRMARETRGIRSAVCTTAVPVTDELAQAIRTAVEASYQSIVDMEFRQDPELMGGYVLRVGDDRYDTSIASGLKKIQQALTRRNLS